MTDIDRQALRDFMATEVMGWHIEHRAGLWTVTECYEGECDIWVDNKGRQKAKAQDDPYVFGNLWLPDLDPNQLDLLVDKMIEDGWGYVFYNCHYDPEKGQTIIEDTWGWFIKDSHAPAITASHQERRLAVLLAIKAAKET